MAGATGNVWMDDARGYGLVTRTLHWGMAALFVWQFTSAALRAFADDTPIEEFFFSTHRQVGALLFGLVLLRGIWGLVNLPRRPRHVGAPLGRAAATGEIVLYALMIVVPALGLLRQYGSGRPFTPFGIPLMNGFDGKIPALVEPANLFHGFLGWVLFATVVGHVVMAVFLHRQITGEDPLGRMTRGYQADIPPREARNAFR